MMTIDEFLISFFQLENYSKIRNGKKDLFNDKIKELFIDDESLKALNKEAISILNENIEHFRILLQNIKKNKRNKDNVELFLQICFLLALSCIYKDESSQSLYQELGVLKFAEKVNSHELIKEEIYRIQKETNYYLDSKILLYTNILYNFNHFYTDLMIETYGNENTEDHQLINRYGRKNSIAQNETEKTYFEEKDFEDELLNIINKDSREGNFPKNIVPFTKKLYSKPHFIYFRIALNNLIEIQLNNNLFNGKKKLSLYDFFLQTFDLFALLTNNVEHFEVRINAELNDKIGINKKKYEIMITLAGLD